MKLASIFIFVIISILGHVVAIEPRIVGGSKVSEGRYDYMVSLQRKYDEISHHCGGTLIASDIVLTAAHCKFGVRVIIGPYALDDSRMESIGIERSIPHPLRQSMTLKDHDVQILKLKEESSYPFIRLNSYDIAPSEGQEIRVLGRGKLSIDERTVPNDLYTVNVTYTSNDKCERGYYEGRITPDTMCAIGKNNTGTCRGDSGGPLIIPGASSEKDTQVGIVSFSSDNCVHVLYPDVYHRVSATYEWIREMICSYSQNPPSNYACDEDNVLYSAAPTQDPLSVIPSASPAPSFDNAPVLVELKVGGKPQDISWGIFSVRAIRPLLYVSSSELQEVTSRFGTFNKQVDILRPGMVYFLEIQDREKDGISGELTIYLGMEPSDDKILAYSNLEDLGPFQRHRIIFVTSPNYIIVRPSPAPSTTSSISPMQPTIPLSRPTIIMVQVSMTSCSSNTGWRIEDTDGQVIFEKPVGSYMNEDLLDYFYSIEVEEGGEYTLVITSIIRYGLHGELIVFLGDEIIESSIIAYYRGEYNSYCFRDQFYDYTINFRASTDNTITVFPTTPPSEPQPTDFFGCFSGNSIVELQNGKQIRMEDAQIGDAVLTKGGTYETIYSFGHLNQKLLAKFVQLQTKSTTLELTSDHLIWVEDQQQYIPASLVEVGHILSNGEAILKIRTVQRRGVYAPFTRSGTIVVNDVVCSTYITMQPDSAYLQIGTVVTPIPWQWMDWVGEQFFMKLNQWDNSKPQQYTSDGVSLHGAAVLSMVRWVLSQHNLIQVMILAPLVLLFLTLSNNLALFCSCIVAAGVILRRRSAHCKI